MLARSERNRASGYKGVNMAVNLLSYTLMDDAGKPGNVSVYFPNAVSLADILAFNTAFAPLLDEVTAARIASASVSLAATLPGGLKAAALADAFISQGANLGFAAQGTEYRHSLRVPALRDALIVGGAVDTTAAGPVDDVVQAVITGVGGATPSDRYSNDITALISASLTFRKS